MAKGFNGSNFLTIFSSFLTFILTNLVASLPHSSIAVILISVSEGLYFEILNFPLLTGISCPATLT